jgi:hypothetical protein
VLVETAPGQGTAQVKLEGRDPSGAWKLLTRAPETFDAPPSPTLRSDTARELRRRGIGYLLCFQNEAVTLDLRSHPDLYGIREVAHNQDARLYQLP